MNGRWLRAALGVAAVGSLSLVAAVRYGHGSTPATARAPALASLNRALRLVPAALAPSPLRVETEPPRRVNRVEIDAISGSLLIGTGAEDLPVTVWLHELGHARMHGSRPRGAVAQRLLRAVDEGAADYYAALLSGTPRVGDASELRDLRTPPRVDGSEWATLALPGFDAHRIGWALAARLYAAEPRRGPLLDELVACLDGESELAHAGDTPAAAVQSLLAACPVTARERLSVVLAAWLPAELSNPESLP